MEAPDISTLTLDHQKPLQAQLYRQLVEWICIERLAPGSRLTSSRQLAKDLGISRNTVTLVIEQLKAEGFLISRQGKGVFVSDRLPSHTVAPESEPWQAQITLPPLSTFGESLKGLPSRSRDASLPFTPGVPDLSAFPVKLWSNLVRRHQTRGRLMGFDGEQGYVPLREALAGYLQVARGVRCKAEQIVITHGAQQAISLCAQLTLNEGDNVLIEDPGYHGSKKAFMARQAKLLPVPLRDNYIDVEYLEQAGLEAKILYVTPTHQYPMGGIMPAGDRLRLLDWAARSKTWILEDDYDSEFSFIQKPVVALQGMSTKTPVLYMGSFSKTLFPSLRIGYLVVPEELAHAFSLVKNYLSGESALLAQAVTADFIAEGHFVRHLRRMRALYQEKWRHLCELINQQLAPETKPIASSNGMHLVIETKGVDDQGLQKALYQKGFGSTALSTYYLGDEKKYGLVMGFANTSAEQRERCVAELARLIPANTARKTT